jgi:hypothetical protein
MNVMSRVQIHQYNDPEILEFFNSNGVVFRLLGDHLFVIRSRETDIAAGPGDVLVVAQDGEVEVQRGDYALRVQRAIRKGSGRAPQRSEVVSGTDRAALDAREALRMRPQGPD